MTGQNRQSQPGQNRQIHFLLWAPMHAARLMNAKAARRVSSLLMCPIAPYDLDAPVSGGVSVSFTPPRRVASAGRRASIASWAFIYQLKMQCACLLLF